MVVVLGLDRALAQVHAATACRAEAGRLLLVRGRETSEGEALVLLTMFMTFSPD